jgi:hypothetical protein
MRTWMSFRTPIRGVRVGAGVSLPRVRIYQVSATGQKVWRLGSAAMLAGLALWLIFSRDDQGRLNEVWWLVTSFVLAVRYLFKLAVVALFPPPTTAGQS